MSAIKLVQIDKNNAAVLEKESAELKKRSPRYKVLLEQKQRSAPKTTPDKKLNLSLEISLRSCKFRKSFNSQTF